MPGGGASSSFALTALSWAMIASRVNSRLSGSAMPQAAAPQIAAIAAGQDRQQDGDRVVTADALRAKECLCRLDAAHQPIVGDDDRIGIERRCADRRRPRHRGRRAGRAQSDRGCVGRSQALPHLPSREASSAGESLSLSISLPRFSGRSGRMTVSMVGREVQGCRECHLPVYDRFRDHAVNAL